jgi:hypothetical protein
MDKENNWPEQDFELIKLIFEHEEKWQKYYKQIICSGDSVEEYIQNATAQLVKSTKVSELKSSLTICNSIINQCLSVMDNIQFTLKLSCTDDRFPSNLIEESEQVLSKSLLNQIYTHAIKSNWGTFGQYGFCVFKIDYENCKIKICDPHSIFFDTRAIQNNKQDGIYCGYKELKPIGKKGSMVRYYYYYKKDGIIYKLIIENYSKDENPGQLNVNNCKISVNEPLLINGQQAEYFPLIYCGEEKKIKQHPYTRAVYPHLFDPQRVINLLSGSLLLQGTLSKQRQLVISDSNAYGLKGSNQTPAAGWNAAGIGTQFTEFASYDEAVRQTWSAGAVSAKSVVFEYMSGRSIPCSSIATLISS